MIQSFRCKETQALFETGDSSRWRSILRQAIRKLHMLNEATELRDMARIPGNRLESLQGDRIGQWSIRINNQWRLCFIWDQPNVLDVEIIDYHH